MSIGHLFNIGQSALHAQQNTIATTGNNIANVNTEGYARQYVQLEDAFTLTNKPGGQGMGVDAVQVLRRFDQFVEVSYLDKSSLASRWEQQSQTMTSVESIFNESNRLGISDSMTEFFLAWQDLAQRPEDPASRQDLVSMAENLSLLMRQSMEDLEQVREQMDLSISVDVDRVNELVQNIADLNKQISQHTIDGVSNPNDLLNQRDLATRELAEIVDVQIEYNDGNSTTIRLTNGLPLVQGHETFSLEIQGPQSESNKVPDSTYTGNIIFDGADSREYTVEMLNGGDVGDVPPPSFRVSLDGGKTWLRNDDGTQAEFEVTDLDGDGNVDPVKVHNISISFDTMTDFQVGDKFNIMPKSGLYWIEPTRGPYNITPQTYFDGTENQDRLSGGTLTAFFTVRDEHIGRYEDELDAVANALMWEVNKLHSQGAGLEAVTYQAGTEEVFNKDIPLGMAQSGLHFYDKLTEGNINFHFYDKETGAYHSGGDLDFTGLGTPPAAGPNFDPSVHSLQDVVDAINTTYGTEVTASILDNKLNIEMNNPDLAFTMGTDTTGVMAGLGINSFFQGTSALDISVNTDVYSDHNRVNAGYVNGGNEFNPGDNSLANGVGNLFTENVQVSTVWRTTGDQSISEYYSTVVAKVGSDTRAAHTNAEYNSALAADLDAQQQSVSGVNLDEEMANLIKFQHSYTAAAKLITTADEMLQTLLGLKQ